MREEAGPPRRMVFWEHKSYIFRSADVGLSISIENQVKVEKVKESWAEHGHQGFPEPLMRVEAAPALLENGWAITRRQYMDGDSNLRKVAVVSGMSSRISEPNARSGDSRPGKEATQARSWVCDQLELIPITLGSQNMVEFVESVKQISRYVDAVCLDSISTLQCYEIETILNDELQIPVMHNEQHGSAIVVFAALINAARLRSRKVGQLKVVIAGDGPAATGIAELLLAQGIADIILVDSQGIISRERNELNAVQDDLAWLTNPGGRIGGLKEAVDGADAIITWGGEASTEDHLEGLALDAVVFELVPLGPWVVPSTEPTAGVGRTVLSTRLNKLLALPGTFQGALDGGSKCITLDMKIAAAHAIADIAAEDGLWPGQVIPDWKDPRVTRAVARAVETTARRSLERSRLVS